MLLVIGLNFLHPHPPSFTLNPSSNPDRLDKLSWRADALRDSVWAVDCFVEAGPSR